MKLQIIKAVNGKVAYVLLPVATYRALKDEIEAQLTPGKRGRKPGRKAREAQPNNAAAKARIKAGLTQQQMAQRVGVSQAYISKIERQEKVSAALMQRINKAARKK